MRFVRDTATASAEVTRTGPTFQVGTSEVDPALFGLTAWDEGWASAVGRVDRRAALQVPAIKKARDLICGTLGGIPFVEVDAENYPQACELLAQPEEHVARSITMVRTIEDLFLEGVAWWLVVERDYRRYPTKVVRLDASTVLVNREQKVYRLRNGIAGSTWEHVEDADLIRFDSPNQALLEAGGRAIRTLLKLEAAAARYADEPIPSGVIERDDADPVAGPALPGETDEEYAAREQAAIRSMVLDPWVEARRNHATAYLGGGFKYTVQQFSPEAMQLVEARQHAVTEIARLTGIDAEELSVSITSRTYFNAQDRRQSRIADVLGPYALAIADRLSMASVTPRGYRVVPDYSGFLRADDATRLGNYETGLRIGLYDLEAIAEREGLPAPARSGVPALRVVRDEDEVVDAVEASAGGTGRAFESAPTVFGFDMPAAQRAFEVDAETRTIYGMALPWEVATLPTAGQSFQFSRGSIVLPADPSRVKLLMQHDKRQPVGKATELTDSPEGLWAKFSIARGPEGDRALQMAEDGVYDGLSVGLRDGGKFNRKGQVHHAVPGTHALGEISLTPDPAFSDARVSAVAAEAGQEGTALMGDTETEPSTETAPTFDMAALAAEMGKQFGLKPVEAGDQGPQVTQAGGGLQLQVTEEMPYRFDRGGNLVAAAHDFSTDLIDGLRNGDRGAYERALSFARTMFDVDSADATALNPSITLPDRYVDQRQFKYGLFAATNAGGLPGKGKTPFIIPKFNTATGLVAAHVEGVEPTAGTFTTTSATVTPGAVSGKVEITRELWDMGGNPAISAIIWRQMERGWYEALEAKVVAVLDAATPVGITLTTGGGTGGVTASNELASNFAALQYVRGGFAFDTFAAQIDLYTRLATAVDSTGRPLFPQRNPTNANGEAAPAFSRMNVHGVDVFPEYALAATGVVAASSYLFDRESVRTWASAPERLEFQYRVAYVDLAIWGYSVSAILDLAGVRELVYDPI